jgi:t-SNARE complex subunit (syntaxin)
MNTDNSNNNTSKINDLKKKIKLLEWDISRIESSEIKILKEIQLEKVKRELKKLLS